MKYKNFSYFSLLIKLFLFGGVLVVNMSLAMWLFGQYRITGEFLPKNLIGNVQAEAPPSTMPPPPRALSSEVGFSQAVRPRTGKPADAVSGRVVLHFEKNAVELSAEQQDRLALALREGKLAAGSRIRILSGPVPLESNILTSQTEKLRAQAVARLIFPYTRAVEIKLRQPALDSGAVAVEFLP
jgi:hypothetical protein